MVSLLSLLDLSVLVTAPSTSSFSGDSRGQQTPAPLLSEQDPQAWQQPGAGVREEGGGSSEEETE